MSERGADRTWNGHTLDADNDIKIREGWGRKSQPKPIGKKNNLLSTEMGLVGDQKPIKSLSVIQ